MIQKVPGLRIVQRGRFKAGESFTPARPLRHAVPQLPQNLAARLTAETPVDLKLRIDTEGRVSTIEVLGAEAQPELARITSTAASRWTFEPARIANRPVESEVLAHFRFRPIE
jgi:outer membrane biosynthesis protein TonB